MYHVRRYHVRKYNYAIAYDPDNMSKIPNIFFLLNSDLQIIVARMNTNNVFRLIIDLAYPGLSQSLIELYIDGSMIK